MKSTAAQGLHFRSGNRDTGPTIRSSKLAQVVSDILKSDMALVPATPDALRAVVPEESAFLVERAPTRRPSRLFPSKQVTLDTALRVQPVLTPDNYMDVVPRDIAQYFQEIFDVDWRTAFRRPEEMFGDEDVSREALGKGGFIRVERADYEEV